MDQAFFGKTSQLLEFFCKKSFKFSVLDEAYKKSFYGGVSRSDPSKKIIYCIWQMLSFWKSAIVMSKKAWNLYTDKMRSLGM